MDEESKEIYLLLLVHGIGSNLESQMFREQELHKGIKKVIKGGYFDSDY